MCAVSSHSFASDPLCGALWRRERAAAAPRSDFYGHHDTGRNLRLFADYASHKTLTKTTHTHLFRLRGQKGRQITLSSFLSSVSGPGSARIDGIAIRRPLFAIHHAELFPLRAPAEAVPFVVDFMPIRQNRTVFRIQVIPIAVRWIEQPTRLQVAVCIKIEASLANAARVGKKYPSVSRISAVLVFCFKIATLK